MEKEFMISTNRIEALSDGVIAIIITIMVFDLKIQSTSQEELLHELKILVPKLLSYVLSFLAVAIMWVSHHQLFHQIRQSDGKLLWTSLHLLFWMSLVPFATNFIGSNPMRWEASFLYGMIFCMTAFAFTLVRGHVVRNQLLHQSVNRQAHHKINRKNSLAIMLYLAGALAGLFSVYISFSLFIIVPAMYFMPEKINHQNAVES